MKLIKPKQYKNSVSKVDSGLKNKRREQNYDHVRNGEGYQMLEEPQSQRRDAAAISHTASHKSQRKRLDWNDYFQQRSERNGASERQHRVAVAKDIDSFEYVGRELDGPNDFQSAGLTMKKGEFTRLIEDNNRAKRPPQFANTYVSRVPLGSTLLRDAPHNGTVGTE